MSNDSRNFWNHYRHLNHHAGVYKETYFDLTIISLRNREFYKNEDYTTIFSNISNLRHNALPSTRGSNRES